MKIITVISARPQFIKSGNYLTKFILFKNLIALQSF